MGAPNSNDSVPVNVQNGGGGLSSAVPSRNPGGAKVKKRKEKPRYRDEEIDPYCGPAMFMLVTFYFFFVFCMVGCYDKWWRSVVSILVTTFFLLLVFCYGHCYRITTTPIGDFYVVEPRDIDEHSGESDLSTRLIRADDLEAADGASKTGPVY